MSAASSTSTTIQLDIADPSNTVPLLIIPPEELEKLAKEQKATPPQRTSRSCLEFSVELVDGILYVTNSLGISIAASQMTASFGYNNYDRYAIPTFAIGATLSGSVATGIVLKILCNNPETAERIRNAKDYYWTGIRAGITFNCLIVMISRIATLIYTDGKLNHDVDVDFWVFALEALLPAFGTSMVQLWLDIKSTAEQHRRHSRDIEKTPWNGEFIKQFIIDACLLFSAGDAFRFLLGEVKTLLNQSLTLTLAVGVSLLKNYTQTSSCYTAKSQSEPGYLKQFFKSIMPKLSAGAIVYFLKELFAPDDNSRNLEMMPFLATATILVVTFFLGYFLHRERKSTAEPFESKYSAFAGQEPSTPMPGTQLTSHRGQSPAIHFFAQEIIPQNTRSQWIQAWEKSFHIAEADAETKLALQLKTFAFNHPTKEYKEEGNGLFSAIAYQLGQLKPPQKYSAQQLREIAAHHIFSNLGMYGAIVSRTRAEDYDKDQAIVMALPRELKFSLIILDSSEKDPTIIKNSDPKAPTIYLSYQSRLCFQPLIPSDDIKATKDIRIYFDRAKPDPWEKPAPADVAATAFSSTLISTG